MQMNMNDPRGPKAVALATDAGQWIKVRDNLGRKAYGIPSSDPGRYYLTTRESCTCPAFEFGRGRDCKHIVAVKLHCDLVREQKQAQKYDDIFARFDDEPKPQVTHTAGGVCAVCGGEDAHDLNTHRDTTDADLSRILGKPQKGVIPAHLIERED